MKTREEFQAKLEEILGSEYVYFQPPDGLRMNRGNRIVYSLEERSVRKADNKPYERYNKYSVTFVTKDPDWGLVHEIPNLFLHCRHDRRYVADNLYHDTFIIYY